MVVLTPHEELSIIHNHSSVLVCCVKLPDTEVVTCLLSLILHEGELLIEQRL